MRFAIACFVLGAFCVGYAIRLFAEASGFTARVTAKEEDSVSFQKLTVVELRFPDGTALTVMGDEELPLMRYLRTHKTFDMELRDRELERVER